MSNWYYVEHGSQVGPLSDDEVKEAVDNGKITATTKVWNGSGDWILADQSSIAQYFMKATSPNEPPPLASEDIDNKYVWLLCFVPALSSILDIMVGTELFLPAIAANIALCVYDRRKLSRAGHGTPEHWATFVVPVYLWQRATNLRHKKYYFMAWLGGFILSIVISSLNYSSIIEETACDLVTEIIQEKKKSKSKCMVVSIDSEVTENFYRATATLDNGNDVDITIEVKDELVYVLIP